MPTQLCLYHQTHASFYKMYACTNVQKHIYIYMPHAHISAFVLAFTYIVLQTYVHECETTHTYMHPLKHTHTEQIKGKLLDSLSYRKY